MKSVIGKRSARMISLSAVLLCLTAPGCRSGMGRVTSDSSCKGGACGRPVSTNQSSDQTPAELFAEMNYEEIAEEQSRDATQAEIAARVPRGPDSLFAGMR